MQFSFKLFYRVFKELDALKLGITSEQVNEFFKQNKYLSEYSGKSRRVAARNRKQFYRKIFSNGAILR